MENSLSCDDVENLLSPFFDNELSEQEFGVVKEHIENCPSCNEKLENIAKLSSVLKESFAKSAQTSENFAQITANKFFSDYYTSCEFVIGELCAYADRELPQKDYLKINEHLAHCECCKNEFESLKLTSQAVSGYLKKDILKYNNDLSIKFIINKVEQAKNRKNLAVSISAIAMLAVVGWLSFDVANINVSFNPDNKKEISYQNPLDKSENFLFKTAYLVPEDGVITVFYENE